MIDTHSIKANVDLLRIIEADNGESTGRERQWCPLCQPGGSQANNSPALQVYSDNTFHCFGCGAGGDAISYIMTRDEVDFLEACKRLGWQGERLAESRFDEIRAENERRQAEIKAQRAADLDRKLSEYSAQEIWEAYQRRMQSDQVAWWLAQGIPQEWQKYLRLGYTQDKIYRDKTGNIQHSPAYTIPYFHQDFKFRNLQYRLTADGISDRYRFEHGLSTTYYMVTPSEPIQDQVIITEGAKKGVVTFIENNSPSMSVLAVPSKSDFGGVVSAVRDCGAVYIVLDPDAWTKPRNAGSNWIPAPIKLAREIGNAARVVDLPGKIDDLFLEGSLDRLQFLRLMMTARQVVR